MPGVRRVQCGVLIGAIALGATAAPAGLPAWQVVPPTNDLRREIADAAQPWRIQIEPMIWYVAPGGTVRLPGAPAESRRFRLEQINLDNPRVSPYGELQLRTAEWRFMISSVSTSQSDRGAFLDAEEPTWIGPMLLNPGDPVTSSIDFSATEVNVGYRIPIPDALVGRGGEDFRGSLEAIGGMRMYTLGLDIGTPQGVVSYNDLFFEPLIGLKFTMEIQQQFNVDVQVSLGGFDDGGHRQTYSYDILTGFSYRPVENVGMQIGYRQLAYGMWTGREEESFNYRGAIAGLFAGVVVRF